MMSRAKKKTLVIGGSLKPERYANRAINMLTDYGHPVVSVGLREGQVAGVDIQTGRPEFNDVDTVTMYVGPANQPDFYDYILGLHPKRIIFNPGTENKAFQKLAIENNIKTINHCTLVMLGEGSF